MEIKWGQMSPTGQKGKTAERVTVWMFAWGKWQIKREDGQIQRTLFSTADSSCSLCWQIHWLREAALEILHLGGKSHWQTAEAATALIAVLIPPGSFQGLRVRGGKIRPKMRKPRSLQEPPQQSRAILSTADIIFRGKKNPGQKDVHVRTHTLQGLEDCSQVIAKLTSPNCSLKCLPPDWLKRLSNGSCNKPCHMLLGNKQKQNKKKLFFALSCYRSRPDTLSQTHY